MRLTEFHDRVTLRFGSTYGGSVLADHVLSMFAGRTAAQAIEDGIDPRDVWRALCAIPYGETASYGEIATVVGQPGAARAVGGANNRNPIAIVIPCHRVIGANGTLTGYGGGLPRKQQLLALETGVLALA